MMNGIDAQPRRAGWQVPSRGGLRSSWLIIAPSAEDIAQKGGGGFQPKLLTLFEFRHVEQQHMIERSFTAIQVLFRSRL